MAGLIERDGRILIGRRPKGGAHGGKWEFPGGKMEAHESPEECLCRELREELGVRVTVGRLFCVSEYDYPDFSIRLVVYRVLAMEGDPSPLAHQELRWVRAGEINGFDFPEADRPVVVKLIGTARPCPSP